MYLIQLELGQQIVGALKLLVGLAGEADDDVGVHGGSGMIVRMWPTSRR